jgi:hypothetical protein
MSMIAAALLLWMVRERGYVPWYVLLALLLDMITHYSDIKEGLRLILHV